MSIEIAIVSPCVTVVPRAVGIDSLYLSHFSDGLGIDWEKLRFEKEALLATPALKHREIEFGGEEFALRRTATRPYSFTLSNKAFRLHLGERIEPRCYAQFSSKLLWTSGLDVALRRFQSIWDTIGSRPTREDRVSRVDAAFDFEIDSAGICIENFVSQAVKDATWRANRKTQSFQFGRGDVVCRFYDKVAEIEEESQKFWFYDIWQTNERIWRAEFQIRGERLKQAGIATIDQMRAYLPGLVKHLARHHTSLRIPSNDTNRSRWPLHPLWRAIAEHAGSLATPPECPPPPLLHGAEYRVMRQVQSLYGQLKGIAGGLSQHRIDNPVPLEELWERLPRLLDRYHSPQLWEADVAAKARAVELGL